MPEVSISQKQSPELSGWIGKKIEAGAGEFLGFDPEIKSRSRYKIDGEELTIDINTEYDIVRANLTEGHIRSLASSGLIFDAESVKSSHPQMSDPLRQLLDYPVPGFPIGLHDRGLGSVLLIEGKYANWASEEKAFAESAPDSSYQQLAQRHSQDPDIARRIAEGIHKEETHIAGVFRRVERVMEEADKLADGKLNSFPGQEEAME